MIFVVREERPCANCQVIASTLVNVGLSKLCVACLDSAVQTLNGIAQYTCGKCDMPHDGASFICRRCQREEKTLGWLRTILEAAVSEDYDAMGLVDVVVDVGEDGAWVACGLEQGDRAPTFVADKRSGDNDVG